jgi:hypothetical protein
MRPGLKTGLRLPSLKKPSLIGNSKQILLDECISPLLPTSVLSAGRWNHDAERLARYGESGQQSEYRLLLGTSKRGYRIRVSYEIKKEKKPLKFSLFSSPNNNFQGLALKHYWQHQGDGALIWYKSNNTKSVYNNSVNIYRN